MNRIETPHHRTIRFGVAVFAEKGAEKAPKMLAYRIIILLAVVMPLPTPCTNVCTLDALGILCIGCGRTLDEIGRWGTMTDQERRAIMERLKAAKS